MTEFSLPDWNAPLELERRLREVPPTAWVKGMYLNQLVEDMRAAGKPHPGRWVAFKNVPMREWLELLVEASAAIHPRVPPREALRRLGQKGYQTFAKSIAGRVIIDLGGVDLASALRVIPTIYRNVSAGSCEIEIDRERRTAVARLRGIWDWPDAWQVGLFEGGMIAFKQRGTVKVRSLSPCDADLELKW
jgi:uncharacterized protein (TIGR02265 family)